MDPSGHSGRTPWTGDQPIAMLLTGEHNTHTHTHTKCGRTSVNPKISGLSL